MAATHTLNSHSYSGRYLQVSLTQTKDAANRRSKITGTVTSLAGTSTWYATGPTTVNVGGTQRYTRARESSGTGQSNRNFVGTISEFYVSHDANGNASVSVEIITAIYSSATQSSSNTWTLDSIGPATTACGAPTSLSVSSTLAEGNVTLSWSGATGGTNNAISSYEIQYSDSSNNSSWGAWTALTTVTTTATSGSTTVAPPGTRGYYRRFQVRTRGAAGASYYSGWKVSTNTLRRNTAPTAPSSFTASPTPYSTHTITLSWSGTAAGTSAISKYSIYYQTSTNGSTWSGWTSLTTVSSSSTSGSTTTSPSRTVGTYTRYRIEVTDTLGAVSSSYTTSNSILCSITACGAPTALSVSSTLSEGNVTLSWSGATSGTNNAISGYEIQYSESSNNSTWGSWYSLTTVSSTSTSGSTSVSPPSTRGYYRRFQIRTQGGAGSSYYSGFKISTNTLRRNTAPTAPPSFTASPSSYSTENVTLSWSGAAAGTSAIKQYNIEYATSTDGNTWSGWASLTTISSSSTSGSTTTSPSRTPGTYTRYRIIATDTLNVVSGYTTSNNILCEFTKATAPSSFSLSASLSEGNVTLSWSGAAPGAGGPISGFPIQYSDSSDNASWGAWTDLQFYSTKEGSGSVSVSPPSTRGNYRRFRIRTEPTTGTEYCSDWVISSGSLRRNTLPTAPSSFIVTPAVYQSGEITLSWSGAVTGTSAIKNYIIQLCTSSDNSTWSAYSALATVTTSATSGNYTYTPGTMAVYTRYRICATDTLDCVSGYTVSASLRKNNPPPVPTIAAPKAGAVTYNTNPRILLTLGTEPDGERQMLCVRGADGVWLDSVNNPESFSRSGWLGSGTAVIYRHGNLAPGGKTITVKAKDEGVQAESGEISRSFTVAASPLAPIVPGVTPVKAAHITAIRTAVNNVRNYYGMTAAVWSEEVTPGRTQVRNWTYHILEIRKAVDQVVETINKYDSVSGFDVPAFEWIPIQPGRPRGSVMEQLHALILNL